MRTSGSLVLDQRYRRNKKGRTEVPNDHGSEGIVLLPPSGPHRVGTEAMHLVDESRPDPWDTGCSRELMVQLWYPAAPVADQLSAPSRYLSLPVAALVLDSWAEEDEEFDPALNGVLAGVRTHAYDGAPVASGAAMPIVLLSPGLGEYRTGLTCLAEELASRGFVVASVDHPSDAAGVELPGGRVIAHQEPEFGGSEGDDEGGQDDGAFSDLVDRYLPTRVDDLRFVLDELLAPHSRWYGLIDPARIGIAGHSLGGAAAVEAARLDSRPAGAAVIDGSLYGGVLTTGLDVPVLLCGLTPPDPNDPHTLAGWEQLWSLLRGPRCRATVRGAGHMSATDFDVLAGPLGLREPGHPDDLEAFGTLPSGRGVAVVRAVLTAFFEEHLTDRCPHLQSQLDGLSEVSLHDRAGSETLPKTARPSRPCGTPSTTLAPQKPHSPG
ncbi:alpha/beta hydrolase [Streptomyces decoyicus]|uniref:alpha/beta hydrolase family protein n=1 Tax=Streptomyces decoyicus TaxID=249567 RepID=UPI00345DB208